MVDSWFSFREDRKMQPTVARRLTIGSGGVWIDLGWKKTSRVSWSERLFVMETVVEIKQTVNMEWDEKRHSWVERKLRRII
jgi:hypothetical protein